MSEVVKREFYDPIENYEEFLDVQRKLQQHVIPDMERALNLIRQYQRALRMLGSPDPNYVEARQLLTKYGMAVGATPHPSYRVFLDGLDITETPDAIDTTVVEVDEITASEVLELNE